MRGRALGTAALAVVAALTLSGCDDDDRPMPVPKGTPSATPDTAQTDAPEAVDPRCVEQYGPKAGLVFEGDIRVRPDGWPTPPEFAVLCWIETLAPTEQAGHYATTYYTPYDKVLDYYEGSFTTGHHGRPDSTDGELLTGVFGDVSYYIVADGTSRYAIHWAIDGYYSE